MLYLSMYSGIDSLEIGIDEGSVIRAPAVESPRSDSPVVMYGTSILQGRRLAREWRSTSILGRKLDREVINLGFSGNTRHEDYEIAESISPVSRTRA